MAKIATLKTVEWTASGIRLVDQERIPERLSFVLCRDYRRVARAIREMTVRGAPAIGVTAAMGVALAAKHSKQKEDRALLVDIERAANVIRNSRPTTRNLFWAVDHMLKVAREAADQGQDVRRALIEEAHLMADEDVESNVKMSSFGASLIDDGDTVLTHCNTGTMATVGHGTAFGVIRTAFGQGKKVKVIATETRPRLQGARITTYEALSDGIPVTLIVDSAAGIVMSKGMVNKVLVGADRITGTAVINKVGTLMLALAAKYHNIPFYAVAPMTTLNTGEDLSNPVIEERDPREVTQIRGRPIAPRGVRVFNPAFDATPLDLVTAVVTDRGVFSADAVRNMSGALALPTTSD